LGVSGGGTQSQTGDAGKNKTLESHRADYNASATATLKPE
jgi:hypothetical protein